MNLITDTSFRNVTLAKVAEERARTHPDDTALLFDSGVRLPYGDAWRQANRLAQAIQTLGVKPGATLTFQLPNIPESVPLAIAASICGLIITPSCLSTGERNWALFWATPKQKSCSFLTESEDSILCR